MDKLLSIGKISKKELNTRIFDKITLYIDDKHIINPSMNDDNIRPYVYLKQLMTELHKNDGKDKDGNLIVGYNTLYNEYLKAFLKTAEEELKKIKNRLEQSEKELKNAIEEQKKQKNILESLKDFNIFKKKVLMFWTASEGILSSEYKVKIDNTLGKYLKSHTCFSQIYLPTHTHITSKEMLYNSLIDIFISSTDEEFTMQ